MKILVTGAAGFIGYHLCKKLTKNKRNHVFGIDNLNSYYDINLKKNRINDLKKQNNKFKFYKLDLKNFKSIKDNFKKNKYDYVIHLAAQAGVRFSLENSRTYLDNNIIVFYNMLELSKEFKIKHLIYASTSSVYGDSKSFPLNENLPTDKPLSFYAATKKCNEIMAYTYSNLYKFKCTGLRFFTVYGPFGRPDMALFKFAKSISKNKKIDLYNKGNHHRDFTYIDDVVTMISKILKIKKISQNFHQIYNVGRGDPQYLMKFISIIEKNFRKKAKFNKMEKQIGDIKKNHADITKISKMINYTPQVDIRNGIGMFINWFKNYYK